MYINKLDDRVHKYNNTYYKTINMKPVNRKPSIYVDFDKESNKKDPKFKFGISKYKILLQNFMFQIGLRKCLWLKKLKT